MKINASPKHNPQLAQVCLNAMSIKQENELLDLIHLPQPQDRDDCESASAGGPQVLWCVQMG